jgi:AraC-like DNA-binding protein
VRGYNFLFVYKNGLTGKGNEHIETGIIPCHVRVRLKRNLMMLMNEKAIYRNPDLRLSLLAKELNTNRTYLSSLIKADFGNSYAGFINHYRVNEAKKLLVDTENNMSINEISEKVGFKSVSSFNIFFKRFTGKTPATFRRLGAKSRLISAIK